MAECGQLLQGTLVQWTEKIFGGGYRPEEAVPLRGGAQKEVHRIRCSNGFRFVLYNWDVERNYFREELEREEQDSPISGFGGEAFRAASVFLNSLQIRTPELYHFEPAGAIVGAAFAFVEFIEGREASDFFAAEPQLQDRIFEPLAEMVNTMHRQERTFWGRLQESPPPALSAGCHKPMLPALHRELDYLAKGMPAIHQHAGEFARVMDDLAAAIEVRPQYGFIHAELGPNHVLVDKQLRPYLIDLDGALYFDPEYEHSFLEFRFANYGRYFANSRLDPVRMAFYKLNHHLSYTAGAHRLLQRGYPDAEEVKGIMDYNRDQALRMLAEYR